MEWERHKENKLHAFHNTRNTLHVQRDTAGLRRFSSGRWGGRGEAGARALLRLPGCAPAAPEPPGALNSAIPPLPTLVSGALRLTTTSQIVMSAEEGEERHSIPVSRCDALRHDLVTKKSQGFPDNSG